MGDVVKVLRLPPGPQRMRAWKPVWGMESPWGIFFCRSELTRLSGEAAVVRAGDGEVADDDDDDDDAEVDAEVEVADNNGRLDSRDRS